jgi:hypothetical protein
MPPARSLTIDPYIVEVLMRDLVGHDRQPSAFLVYLLLHARSAETPQHQVTISLRDIAEATGLSKSVAQIAMRTLKRRQLVTATQTGPTAVPRYRVLRPWSDKNSDCL